MLTLTGPGGAGKTRLSIEVACYSLNYYPGGVWLVELASLTDPALVVPTVASAIGLHEESDRSLLATLVEWFEDRHALLALDNCEHLRKACASLVDTLLLDCPQLHVLATSRVALGIADEMVWPVPSMSFPDPNHMPTMEKMERYEAVQLFVERTRQKQPDFQLTRENMMPVAQLCYALDGMPLALELAAARTSTMTVAEIAAGLDERFRLLVGGSRAAPTRQQTLKAAIDWGYDLLSHGAQELLARLSVFAGGFSLEAVESICIGEGDEQEAMDTLRELVDQSLVITGERGGVGRYRLLDTIRQYAALKLKATGGEDALYTRYIDWYLRLAEQSDSHLQGPDQSDWLEQLQADHENFRAALEWSLTTRHDAGAGLRLVNALDWFWYVRDYWTEGRKWLEEALRQGEGQPADLLADVYYGAGLLARKQSDYADATDLFNKSIELFRALGDKKGVSTILSNLGVVATSQGDYPRATEALKESLGIRQEMGDENGVAGALNNLANIAVDQGDYGIARSYLKQSVTIQRKSGNKLMLAISLNNLGHVARCLGEYVEARKLVEEALEIKRALDNKAEIASSLNRLAEIEWRLREYEGAQRLCEEGLTLLSGTGDKEATALLFNTLGEIARCQGEYVTARNCYEEALAASTARWIVPDAMYNLGHAAQQTGDYKHAAASLGESLQAYIEIGAKKGIAECFVSIAKIVAAAGSPGPAAHLFGAADGFLKATGYRMHPQDYEELERIQREVRAQLGNPSWKSAWRAGHTMPEATVTSLAMEAVQAILDEARPGEASKRPSMRALKYPYNLTRREMEVLRLLAEGLTDHQIAEQLFLSSNTVHSHLRSIYGKLDVATRSAAVRFASKEGLI